MKKIGSKIRNFLRQENGDQLLGVLIVLGIVAAVGIIIFIAYKAGAQTWFGTIDTGVNSILSNIGSGS